MKGAQELFAPIRPLPPPSPSVGRTSLFCDKGTEQQNLNKLMQHRAVDVHCIAHWCALCTGSAEAAQKADMGPARPSASHYSPSGATNVSAIAAIRLVRSVGALYVHYHIQHLRQLWQFMLPGIRHVRWRCPQVPSGAHRCPRVSTGAHGCPQMCPQTPIGTRRRHEKRHMAGLRAFWPASSTHEHERWPNCLLCGRKRGWRGCSCGPCGGLGAVHLHRFGGQFLRQRNWGIAHKTVVGCRVAELRFVNSAVGKNPTMAEFRSMLLACVYVLRSLGVHHEEQRTQTFPPRQSQ